MQNVKTLASPAVLRLAAYVVAGIIGIVMVAVGRLDAGSLEDWVSSTQTHLGTLLTVIASLAAVNIDRTGTAPTIDVADLPTVREAVEEVITSHVTDIIDDAADEDGGKHRLEDRVDVTVQKDVDPTALLAEMQRRIDATRAGRAARG